MLLIPPAPSGKTLGGILDMYKFYADDSALKKTKDDLTRPVFLLGGILISRADELALSTVMKKIKQQYTGEDMPLKYNIKDVEDVYKRFERLDEFEKLKKDSVNWRKQILSESLNFDYTIFISCIENFQADKKEQKPIKQDLSSYLFSNTLMRVGLYAQDNELDYTQVILDWPEGSNPQPFDKEYYYAYNRGTNSDGQIYYCGALKKLGFDQTLYYARCHHSNLIQLADIIVGSTRDWIETELQGREYSVGKELSQIFLPKFYGYPKIFKYGINVSTKNSSFRQQINNILTKTTA